jgi:arginase family enzyme
MLLSVSARVFTGASEAQVNFTSLILDQHLDTHTEVNDHALLHQSVLKSAEGATSIPEKHRTYATYKKYVTPDKSLSVELVSTKRKAVRKSNVTYVNVSHIHSSIFSPVANSPPAVVSAHLHTHTTTTNLLVDRENILGEIAINNSAGRLISFQL